MTNQIMIDKITHYDETIKKRLISYALCISIISIVGIGLMMILFDMTLPFMILSSMVIANSIITWSIIDTYEMIDKNHSKIIVEWIDEENENTENKKECD